MISRRPWFMVRTSKDANPSGSRWSRLDAASLGKLVVRPITSEGWVLLAVCVVGWIAATLVIWVLGFRSGEFSLAFAILATVLVAGIVIAIFVRFVVIGINGSPPPA